MASILNIEFLAVFVCFKSFCHWISACVCLLKQFNNLATGVSLVLTKMKNIDGISKGDLGSVYYVRIQCTMFKDQHHWKLRERLALGLDCNSLIND